MNSVILCEGKTDAILLSYYLEKVKLWQHCKRPPKGLNIQVDKEKRGESAYWYEREQDKLLICGVGGKDRFSDFFSERIWEPLYNDVSGFSKMVIVTDRDDRDISEIVDSVECDFNNFTTCVKANVWVDNYFKDSYGMEKKISVLLLVVPNDAEGALETVLLQAISEDLYDKVIVEKSREFVNTVKPNAQRYLKRRRLELKAQLSVTWAIQSPDKAFDFIDEQIRSVPWEKYDTISRCFSPLLDI